MRNKIKVSVSAAMAALALAGGLALGVAPIASAGTKSMDISATGGDKTTIDHDGTQGSFTDSVQGKEDSDGDQDAFDLTKSEEATPQEKAPNKMSK